MSRPASSMALLGKVFLAPRRDPRRVRSCWGACLGPTEHLASARLGAVSGALGNWNPLRRVCRVRGSQGRQAPDPVKEDFAQAALLQARNRAGHTGLNCGPFYDGNTSCTICAITH